MEARGIRASYALCLVFFAVLDLMAASHRTENFIVTADSRSLAVEVGNAAEHYRATLAKQWLGHELPRWSDPCPIQVTVDPRLGAGGETSFMFQTNAPHHFARPSGDGLFRSKPAGRPFGWRMSIQGSRERVLDSVLPHEITHTIFATHFGRPLPRWADEGACTTVEHSVEKSKQHRMLYEFLTTDRGIAFNRMFAMTEYPADILPLYSQGFSLSRFLIAQGGRQKFVRYIEDGLDTNDWTATTKKHYGYASLSELQITWLDWVRQGSPNLPPAGQPRGPVSRGPEAIVRATPQGTLAAATAQPEAQKTSQLIASASTGKGDSWYARQRTDQGEKPSRPPLTRVASRLNEKSPTREVLLEWGSPTPILAPRLKDD